MSNETTRADNNAIILKLEVVGVVAIRIYGIEIISNLYCVYSNYVQIRNHIVVWFDTF